MAEIMEDTPQLGELWLCFVNGLKEGIKFQLIPPRTQTLTDASCLAKEVEPCHPPQNTTTRKQGLSYTNYYQKQNVNFQSKQYAVTPHQQQLPHKQTETNVATIQMSRKCWICGDKWVYGHKCKLFPDVHLLPQEVEDHPTAEEEDLRQQQEEILEEGEHAMFISAHSMGQQLAVPTPNVVIHINAKRAYHCQILAIPLLS